MRQLVHSLSGDNNLVPFHLWLKEIVLKTQKVYEKVFVQDCSGLSDFKVVSGDY